MYVPSIPPCQSARGRAAISLDALRRMLDADPRALSDPKWQSAPFCNGCQAANPIFGSEKAFAHRVLKSCPVRKFTLPIVGVVR